MKKILLLSLIISGSVIAEQTPQPFLGDVRVKRVAFQENNVVNVHAGTFTATQILFGRHEKVLAVEGGDTAAWMVTLHDNLPNMIFVKPTVLESHTNMTVITNQHPYYFHLVSNKNPVVPSTEATYAIKFHYPEDERKAQEQLKKSRAAKELLERKKIKDPKTLNWNYRFSGNTQIMPAHVYDDGRFTWFELQKNQPVPAVFAVESRDGKESVVNTRREGNLLVVQRLAPQFTLRNGGMVASVFNTNEIARIKQGRRQA